MATMGLPLVVLTSLASKLLGRAVAACLAPLAAPLEHSVVLEIHQSSQSPGRLQLRVCDDGAAMAADTRPLERWAVGLGPLLACPVFEDAQLLAQSTGLEEAVVRRYRFQAASEGGEVSLHVVGDAAKPPGSTLCGSVFQLTILLQQQLEPSSGSGNASGSHQQPAQPSLATAGGGHATPATTHQQQRLPASADEVVCCLQQLLGMVRVLAPPVRLLMRLNGVLLQAPDGSLQPASGSRRLDLSLPASLDPLRRLQRGIASEFLTSPPALSAAAQGQRPAAAEHGGPEAVEGQPPDQQLARTAAAGPVAASTAAAPARVMQGSQPLLYVGVGEAGWGCTAAVQQFRGVKWAARAGLVLQVPDHEALQAAAEAQAAAGQLASGAPDGGAQGGCRLAGGGTPPTPVCVFRSWEVQLGPAQQQHVQKGLQKCAWGSYGFALQSISSRPDGALEARLACAEPRCGAHITACVLHLTPCEYQSLAEAGQHPGLPKSHEARLVSRALEGALQHLKQQCPALLSSRRERSLARSLPLLGSALAGILHQSAEGDVDGAMTDEGSALYHACTMVGCEPADLQRGIVRLLQQVTSTALLGATAAEGSVAAQSESQSLSADTDSNTDPQY